MNLSKKNIILWLIIIGSISLGLKLYLVDFSIPVYSDDLGYTLNAIAHSKGDFTQSPDKGEGWPFFISLFFRFIDSNNFIDYSNIVRVISLTISSATILPVYLLGRKFFNEKYSLVMASLFAFEPHLNYTAGFGLAEPLYHLIIIAAFYFILNKDSRSIYVVMLLAGFLWWIRINGFIWLPIISLIYFINFRKCQNLLKNYGVGLVIFLIIVSPMLTQRYHQYGDPFYSWYGGRIFAGDYEQIVSKNTQNTNPSALDYINKNGITQFIQKFIITGIYNILDILTRISFPYLIILIPFGILFSLRPIDQDKKFIRANWIAILISLGMMITTLSIFPERRYLFYLIPLLIIFATIPIQRITEYGLSTFSFPNKKKKIFLIIVICIIVILSGLFTVVQYNKPDIVMEKEKMEFAEWARDNLHGKILDEPGHAMDYFSYVQINDPPGIFKNYKIDPSKEPKQGFLQVSNPLIRIYVYGESIQDLITRGEEYELRYVVSNERAGVFHPFVDDVYKNEKQYPYLVKVFDSDEKGFKKLKIKVFEIDYKKFHE